MVSGFLISPYDQERICSGLAIWIFIWSNVIAWPVWPRIFISSFMRLIPQNYECVVSSCVRLQGRKFTTEITESHGGTRRRILIFSPCTSVVLRVLRGKSLLTSTVQRSVAIHHAAR